MMKQLDERGTPHRATRSPRSTDLLELVERYGRDLRNFARYRTGNDADADDAFQDAMVSALRYLDSFRGETSVKNWLLMLVTSAARGRQRGRKNDPKLHVALDSTLHPELERFAVSRERPADELAILEDDLAALRAALDTLPAEDRRLLAEHHGDERGLGEIARELKVSVPCIKTRIYRARSAVRKIVMSREAPAAA